MVEDVALVGPPEKIREELPRWRDTCITTFLVGGSAAAINGYAEALLELTAELTCRSCCCPTSRCGWA